MDTPILRFLEKYRQSGTIRAHMPGHKGRPFLGPEPLDLTEITGADSLFEADGIIRASEKNAASLFGSDMTFFSTEGSSLCIKAMLLTALRLGAAQGRAPLLLAGRNAHRSLLNAACLLGFDIHWLSGKGGLLNAQPGPEEIEKALSSLPRLPFGVYLTSPDYLGGMADIASAARVCRKRGVPLLIDNAHGAYLRFLTPSLHPLQQGAQLCCDSAHKTLPALTGAAYLHVRDLPGVTERDVREALSLFASSSPSYLTLASLDLVNGLLSGDYPEKIRTFCGALSSFKERLAALGWACCGKEPMKLTLSAWQAGWRGSDAASHLRKNKIECEFADPDYTVLMLAPGQEEALTAVEKALASLPPRPALPPPPPAPAPGDRACSVRAAMLAPAEEVPAEESLGRILAAPCVSCPPAVPILVCGERVTKEAVALFLRYRAKTVRVVRADYEKHLSDQEYQ